MPNCGRFWSSDGCETQPHFEVVRHQAFQADDLARGRTDGEHSLLRSDALGRGHALDLGAPDAARISVVRSLRQGAEELARTTGGSAIRPDRTYVGARLSKAGTEPSLLLRKIAVLWAPSAIATMAGTAKNDRPGWPVSSESRSLAHRVEHTGGHCGRAALGLVCELGRDGERLR